jgi:hypothetical protein
VTLEFGDTATPPARKTNQWSFTVANLPILLAAFRTPTDSGRDTGFSLRMAKAPNDSDPTIFTNTAARAELQVSGTLVDPNTGEPFLNEASGPSGNGTFAEITSINYQQDGNPIGYFENDQTFPGVDSGDPNFIALECTTHLQLTAGLHRFGVRSDDGFRLTAGPTFTNATVELGAFEGGRGSALPDGSTEFEFLVEAAGVYAFRLIWYEGTGDADLEWFSVDRSTLGSPAVTRTLINDPAAGSIKAYRNREGSPTTGPNPPTLQGATFTGSTFGVSFPTEAGFIYSLEYKTLILDPTWQVTASTVAGDGTVKTLTHTNPAPTGFYRVVAR